MGTVVHHVMSCRLFRDKIGETRCLLYSAGIASSMFEWDAWCSIFGTVGLCAPCWDVLEQVSIMMWPYDASAPYGHYIAELLRSLAVIPLYTARVCVQDRTDNLWHGGAGPQCGFLGVDLCLCFRRPKLLRDQECARGKQGHRDLRKAGLDSHHQQHFCHRWRHKW